MRCLCEKKIIEMRYRDTDCGWCLFYVIGNYFVMFLLHKKFVEIDIFLSKCYNDGNQKTKKSFRVSKWRIECGKKLLMQRLRNLNRTV